jgi:hypothetical protein
LHFCTLSCSSRSSDANHSELAASVAKGDAGSEEEELAEEEEEEDAAIAEVLYLGSRTTAAAAPRTRTSLPVMASELGAPSFTFLLL